MISITPAVIYALATTWPDKNSKDPKARYKNKIESATSPTALDAKSAFIFPFALSGE